MPVAFRTLPLVRTSRQVTQSTSPAGRLAVADLGQAQRCIIVGVHPHVVKPAVLRMLLHAQRLLMVLPRLLLLSSVLLQLQRRNAGNIARECSTIWFTGGRGVGLLRVHVMALPPPDSRGSVRRCLRVSM